MRRTPLNFTEADPGLRAARPRNEAGRSGDYIEIDLANPEHVQFLRNGGASGSSHVSETTAMRVASVWRCVHLLAGVPGNMPLDLLERVNDRERRPASLAVRRLMTTRPNHWQTPQDFKRMLTAHVALRGAGYAYKVPGVRGVQALWPIHPDRCQAVMTPDMEMAYRYTTPRGVQTLLSADDVLHVRGLSLDGVNGVGVLTFAREQLANSRQAQRAAGNLIRQGTLAGGALQVPDALSEEAYQRLQDSLSSRNVGEENAGKWLILEEGTTAAKLDLTAEDLQFLESRQFTNAEIAMFFGVPPHMIGDTQKSTSWGSGIEQQKDGFIAFTAEDYLTAWEQALVRDLLKDAEQDRYFWRFARAALLRGDTKTRFAAYTQALQWGWMSPDEVRALEDMNPRADGLGGQYYDPPNTAGGEAKDDSEEPDDAPDAPRDR